MQDIKNLQDRQSWKVAVLPAAAARREDRTSAKPSTSPSASPSNSLRSEPGEARLGNSIEICSPSGSQAVDYKGKSSASVGTTQHGQNLIITADGNQFVADPRTGEMRQLLTADQHRQSSYKLQSIARDALDGYQHPKTKKVDNGFQKRWAVGYCGRGLAYGSNEHSLVDVLRSQESGRVKFGNLACCGSVWTCALCARKITEFRKTEIAEAMLVHQSVNGACYMVTLTFAHSRHDKLPAMTEALRAALRRMRSRDAYKALKDDIEYVGLIRALEVTWGASNGWHPHVHELWLTARAMSAAELAVWNETLFGLWQRACRSAGLALPTREYGLTIVLAQSPAEYLAKWGRDAKWGVTSELTKAHLKRDQSGQRFTPFDFLRAIESGETSYVKQFREFSTGTYGMRQLFWSHGLKAILGIKELSDEQIAEQTLVEHDLVTRIDQVSWLRVVYGRRDYRAALLEAAERDGAEGVYAFIRALAPSPYEAHPASESESHESASDPALIAATLQQALLTEQQAAIDNELLMRAAYMPEHWG